MMPVKPILIPMPFAQNGNKNEIPADSPGASEPNASWSAGFPPITMFNRQAGGLPPLGQDFNGILNALSQQAFWRQSGGMAQWSADLDYPVPALVVGSDGKYYTSVQPSGPSGAGAKDPTDAENSAWWAQAVLDGSAAVFTPPTGSEPGKKGLVPAPGAMSAEDAANTYLSADGTWSDISSKFMQCGINSISFEAGTGGAPAAFTNASSSVNKSTTFNFSKVPVTRQIGRQIASTPNDEAIVINEDGLYHVAGHLNISVGAYSGNVGMRTDMKITYNDSNIFDRSATCNQTTPDGGLRTNLHCLFWLPKGTKISFKNVYMSNSPTRTHQAIHVDILQIESGFPDAVKTFFDEFGSSSSAMLEEQPVTLEFVQSMKLAEFDSVMGDIDQALIRPVSDLLDALVSPSILADDDTAPGTDVLAASRAKFLQLRELQIRNRKLRAKVLEAATVEEVEAFQPVTAESAAPSSAPEEA